MHLFKAFALSLLPATALAAPKVEDCYLDIRATEGGQVTVYSDGGEIRHVVADALGETGRFSMAVTPMADGDAILDFSLYRYSRHIAVDEGPFVVELVETRRAIVLGGGICETEECFPGSGEITRDDAQAFYGEYLEAFPNRSDCRTRFQF